MPDLSKKDDKNEEQPEGEKTLVEKSAEEAVKSDVPDLAPEQEAETDDIEKPIAPDLVPEPEDQTTQESEEDTPFDDEKTERAINEIVAKEGDDLLAVQDAASIKGGVKPKRTHSFWSKKWVRSLLVLIVLGGVVALAIMPQTRYYILNTAGVRSSSSLTVVDSTTQLPLKGVHISLAGRQADTDSEGKAKFSNLKLGPAMLDIDQVGFEHIKRNIVIGWGSNPFGNIALKATGVQHIIEVSDYLSDKPVEGVEATDGDATAVSGKDGKITLTLASTVVTEGGVSLIKAGYRTEKITLNPDPKQPTKVALVLARKAVFVVKQSGKYDVYKSDIDGKNKEVLLAGTGSENNNSSLAVSPDGTRAALVSTRDNKHDSDGFLLSGLALINVDNGEKTTVAESPQIQLIDWIGSRLIFQQASTDGASGSRYVVTSYNYADNTRLQLAAANNLTAVMSARGAIYYAVGADDSSPSLQLGLFRVNPDGSGKQRLFEDELSTVLRSSYDIFNLQKNDGTWYSYEISKGSKSQIGTPANLANRLYVDNTDRSLSLWIGQGTLNSYEVSTGKDVKLVSQSGLAYPVQWLGPTAAIYRLSVGGETADYAASTQGGVAHKVSDVAATYGFAQAQ